uniref:Uncharacterized protein n=1 Tax=Nelumbo nucifera TaxID=4432 RepID=A0A822XNQ6_NELNU|nr:TPA_asm: hypothetical protein HUJ06_022029 [Nelumbo nucifera]
MNSISRLPVVQINNFLHSPKRNQEHEYHRHPLHSHIPNPNKQMCHEGQQQPHHRIQESYSKSLCSELHSRPLVEEDEF